MSIEQDLHTIPTPKTPKHEAFLKAALTTHMPAKRSRKLKLVPLLALAPVFALLLFVTIAIVQPTTDNKGEVTQKPFGPLTPQRVFALAQEGVDDQSLKPGQYYYIKVEGSTIIFDDDKTCRKQSSVSEYYTNEHGINQLAVHKTVDGKLYLVTSENEKGDAPGSLYFSDQEAEKTTFAPTECPIIAPLNEAPLSDQQVDIDSLLSSPEFLAQQDLLSNVPERQRKAYDVLGGLKDWSIVENQTTQGYDKPVIMLMHFGDNKNQDVTYMFDQATKKFVGFENVVLRSIVVDRGIRTLPNIPEAENKVTPPGL